MYDELIADLRRHHCNAKEDDTQEVCDECPYDVIIADKSRPNGIASVCVCGLMNRAADALEELQKRVPPAPHGRLIDADELHKLFIEKGKEFKGIGGAMLAAAAWCVANAPTIIPADDEHTMEEFMCGQEGNPNDGSM